MKKSNYLYILLAVLLIVAAYLVIQSRSGGWSPDEFSIKDTSEVQLITIASENQEVVLNRRGDTWLVNDRFPAGRERIGGLLVLLSRIKIAGTVPSSLEKEISESLESTGKRILIANKNKVISSFIVYHDTSYSDQTYMIHENGNRIYRVDVPGVRYRNIAILFNSMPAFWKSKVLFQYRPEEIEHIVCVFPDQQRYSFHLVNIIDDGPQIFTYPDSLVPGTIDTERVVHYLGYYSRVMLDRYLTQAELNSLEEFRSKNPVFHLRLKDLYGRITEIDSYTAYYKSDIGEMIADLNEFYLLINKDEWAKMKYIELDPIAKQIDYFISD